MLISWKVFLTIFILYTIAIDGNRVSRRRRRQAPMGNAINQQQLPPNPRVLNGPDQPPPQQGNPNDVGTAKQGGRQFYSPYQGQYGGGYGSIQSLNYPFAGAGVGSYNYGSGQYGQYGGLGSYGGLGQYGYGSYNQNPSYYSGYNSGSYYNRPGYSNYYPSSGSNYGGYFWNAGQKQNINKFTVFLSSMLTLLICLITV